MIRYFEITDTEEGYTAWFKVRGKNDVYSIRIKIKNSIPYFELSDCSCPWGSVYGYRKDNTGKPCCHLNECLDLLKREAWLDENWEKLKKEIN